MELPGTIWIALFLLVTFVTVEVLNPKIINEGFNLVSAIDVSGEKNFFSKFALRRGDIGENREEKYWKYSSYIPFSIFIADPGLIVAINNIPQDKEIINISINDIKSLQEINKITEYVISSIDEK
jgi:type IV secretory pathway VirB3-like protein